MDETTLDQTIEVENEQTATYDDFVEEQKAAGDGVGTKILIGVGAAATGIAVNRLWKKFGPSVKSKADAVRKARLQKQAAKLAERELKVKAKLEKLEPEVEETETK